MKKRVFGILIIAFAILSALFTPIESRFAMHIGEVDFRMSLLDIAVSFTKKQHILNFGILSLLVLNYFQDRKDRYKYTFLYVFVFSIFIELIQIFFVEGHFRARDLISNLTGIIFSLCIFRVFEKHLKEASGFKTAIINIAMIVIQAVLTLLSYYVFKEISVMLGGEGIRKFL